MKIKQILKEDLTYENAESKFNWHGIEFDNIHGLGAVPDNSNVLYKGFIGIIRPIDFIQLASKADRSTSAREIASLIKEGNPIGCPFLSFEYEQNQDNEIDYTRIVGHEGRARVGAIQLLSEEGYFKEKINFIPVCFLGTMGIRARHLDSKFFDFIKNTGFIKQNSDSYWKPYFKNILFDKNHR